ncbi:NAD(P)-binding oxidoreductase [Cellulosimicrobium sp. Marseille-Q4280]|uniref:NAD(P)-dependent oxidoreductase n=1 Tax=Cellulosimicrobium sp. Marseille-Q4280 TaxID=2937992 RepID=UPI0020423BE3|nr:NAD(P)-binding oxidoreductase [Cellulosimicrobium sp. Marseille-Q4280]
MHLVVAGASGATGTLLIRQAVDVGHRVTALVRDASRYQRPHGVHVQEAEVVTGRGLALPDDVDVVVSVLGKRSYQDSTPVCADGVTNLLAAMGRHRVRRMVAVSASPVLRSGAGEPWWFRKTVRPYVRRSGPLVYADLEAMEDVLRGTGDEIDWTILRPGYLVDEPPAGYRLVPERNAMGTVRRADLAAALLAVATNPETSRTAYGLASLPSRRRRAGRQPDGRA